jgi:hypothetical protein
LVNDLVSFDRLDCHGYPFEPTIDTSASETIIVVVASETTIDKSVSGITIDKLDMPIMPSNPSIVLTDGAGDTTAIDRTDTARVDDSDSAGAWTVASMACAVPVNVTPAVAAGCDVAADNTLALIATAVPGVTTEADRESTSGVTVTAPDMTTEGAIAVAGIASVDGKVSTIGVTLSTLDDTVWATTACETTGTGADTEAATLCAVGDWPT